MATINAVGNEWRNSINDVISISPDIIQEAEVRRGQQAAAGSRTTLTIQQLQLTRATEATRSAISGKHMQLPKWAGTDQQVT
jgi:hypothetical protein